MDGKRVLVCGDRNWRDACAIYTRLYTLPPGSVIIHGAARGADTLAGQEAAKLGMEVIPFPAEWSLYGRAAGVIRNQQMLDEGKPDLVIAFHGDLENSRGTADMVRRARGAGVPVEIITGRR